MVQPVLSNKEEVQNPANKALLLLITVSILPIFLPIPVNISIVSIASLCVFTGCWKSVKAVPPLDSMSRSDAMTFPLIGSAVLLGLFLLFKFLPKDLVNTVLTAYFVLIGIFAMTVTLAPFAERLFSEKYHKKTLTTRKISIPYILKEPLDLSLTIPELAAGAVSSGICIWYFLQKHWLANNTLGLAFSIQGIEHLSLGSFTTGIILLSGLFVYDIFWVFCTPVMVSVAKSFDAPIKLLFPRAQDPSTSQRPFSMLGLGDIVIPGIFVALTLRYDVLHKFKTNYFYSTYTGYVLGLGTTIAVMNFFNAAQPALLYIVPAIVLSLLGHAAYRGQLNQVLAFQEGKEAEAKLKKADTSPSSFDGVDKVDLHHDSEIEPKKTS